MYRYGGLYNKFPTPKMLATHAVGIRFQNLKRTTHGQNPAVVSTTSGNCGDFCCKWVDGMWAGKDWKDTTKYNAVNGEKDIEKYKIKWNLV